MAQQPQDDWEVEDEWEVVDTPSSTVKPPTVTTPEQPGMLSRAWHTLSDPLTDAPSRFAKGVADYIDSPSLNRSPTMARIKGFGAGAIEGIGDMASSLTSPINLGTAITTGGNSMALKAGLPRIAQAMRVGAKGAGALTAGHGTTEVLRPDATLAERGMGLVEMAGGIAGMKGPKVKPPSQGPTVTAPAGPATSLPVGVVDTFEKYRNVAIGTKYKVSPGDLPRKKLVDAIRLGFEYGGLDENGRIILKKVKESPPVALPKILPKEESKIIEALNLPRAIMASWDMSAPLRQGLPLWHKKAFWTSLPAMVKAWGSEEAYEAIQNSIKMKPLFRNEVSAAGKLMPSFAEKAGLKLTDLTNLSTREESIMSTWAEKLPGVTRSNRAYTAFLNKLRADTFEQLVKDGDVFGAHVRANMPRARALAEFVNYASGRGSLGRAEKAAVILNTGFFAPRLIASRLKILNPWTYINPATDSMARKESIKSLLALATAGNAAVQLAKAGGLEVENDPASSDFGKVKIGNVRLDPWAGAQQYIVAANRILKPSWATAGEEGGMNTGIGPIDLSTGLISSPGGKFKSSISGSEYQLGEKYGGSNRLTVAGRFLEGKANPLINFATGLARGKDLTGQPFNVPEQIVSRFVPIFVQDLKELLTENPNLIPGIHEEGMGLENLSPRNAPFAIPSFFGMGMQHYGPTED